MSDRSSHGTLGPLLAVMLLLFFAFMTLVNSVFGYSENLDALVILGGSTAFLVFLVVAVFAGHSAFHRAKSRKTHHVRQTTRPADSPQAAPFVPADWRAQPDRIISLSGAISELFQMRATAVIQVRKLLELASLAPPAEGELPPATSKALSQMLDRISVAIEPDYRYDKRSPGLNDRVIIFKADYGGPIEPDRPAYRAMKTKIEATALIVATNGKTPGGKFESVKGDIATSIGFSGIERARLLAYAFALLTNPPKESG
jgi:hypothetical protein